MNHEAFTNAVRAQLNDETFGLQMDTVMHEAGASVHQMIEQAFLLLEKANDLAFGMANFDGAEKFDAETEAMTDETGAATATDTALRFARRAWERSKPSA